MSAVSLINVAQSLSNQSSTQNPNGQFPVQTPPTQSNQQSQAVSEDQFTPSAQNNQAQDSAQAAGLFTVSQSLSLSPAASLLIGQNTGSQVNQPVAISPAANAAAPAPQPETNNVPAAQTTAPAVPGPATSTAAAPTPASATDLAATQEQLLALNLSLASLGLSTQDIQQLDQIASTINDYNPSAYTTRAYQLEALAQRTPPQPASATTPNTHTDANTANPTTSISKIVKGAV